MLSVAGLTLDEGLEVVAALAFVEGYAHTIAFVAAAFIVSLVAEFVATSVVLSFATTVNAFLFSYNKTH